MSLWLLLLIFLKLKICSAVEIVFINSSVSLEEQLCNSTDHQDDKIHLVLNSSLPFFISMMGSFCTIENADIVILSNTDRTADIHCTNNSNIQTEPYPTGGIVFVNSTVKIERVAFINCGAKLITLSANISGMLNKSYSLTYLPHYAAVLIFIECEAKLNKVRMLFSYGFAIIGINLNKSVFTNSYFSSELPIEFGATQNISIGNGVLIHYFDAIHLSNISRNITISDSVFTKNTGYSTITKCLSDIYKNDKSVKHVLSATGITVLYTQKYYQVYVLLNGLEFSYNFHNGLPDSLFILHYNTSHQDNTEIRNCEFIRRTINNEGKCSRNTEFTFLFIPNQLQSINNQYQPLLVQNTTFHHYKSAIGKLQLANLGGIVYVGVPTAVKTSVNIKFLNVTFRNNIASDNSVCLFVDGSHPNNVNITLESVIVTNNNLTTFSQVSSSFGIITLTGVTCIVNGTIEYPSLFKRNYGAVFNAIDSTSLFLHGYLVFEENRASTGAAINIKGFSQLFFMTGLVSVFKANQASSIGGAIHAVVNTRDQNCAFNFEDPGSVNITFINNSAVDGGSAVYAYPIVHCCLQKNCERMVPASNESLKEYQSLFSFIGNTQNTHLDLSTKPTKFVIKNSKLDGLRVYPGQRFSVCLIAQDAFNRSVYAQLKVELPLDLNEISGDSNTKLLYDNTKQVNVEGKQCTNLILSFQSTKNLETAHKIIFYYPNNVSVITIATAYIKTCPLGFSINAETGSCGCSQALIQYQLLESRYSALQCYIQTQTFKLLNRSGAWAGLIVHNNISVFAVSSNCPVSHCIVGGGLMWFTSNKLNQVLLKDDPNSMEERPVCINNRKGPLCGICKKGLSHVFGSFKCISCHGYTNYWLYPVLIFVAGIFLVLSLFVLKLTLTSGTLNGVIFYIQISNAGLIDLLLVNNAIKEHSQSLLYRTVHGFLLVLNLEPLVPVCFYDGMNKMIKVALGLLVPIYLLLVVIFIIILSHYSTRISNWTSHLSVQVLVTIIHLSFAKLLIAILDVFTPAIIHTDEGPFKVWYWDGSVEYMGREHQYLVIFSVLVIIPLTVPYIILLGFSKPLLKFSMTNRYLRPFIEAVHAPYKNGKEHWFLLRLLLVIIVYIIYAVHRGDDPLKVYVSTTPIVVLFVLIQAHARPYKVNFINVLDLWIAFNCVFIYCTTWYYVVIGNTEASATTAAVCTLLILLTFVCIVLCHVICMTPILSKIKSQFKVLKSLGYLNRFQLSSLNEEDETRAFLVDSISDGCICAHREEMIYESWNS